MNAIGKSLSTVVVIFALTVTSYAQQGQIRGELYGVDGERLAGAKIMLDQRDGAGNRHIELESDSRGEFVHLSVQNAMYQLTLEIDGRQTAVVLVRIGPGENPLRLDLERGELESYEYSRVLGISERVVRELDILGENERVALPGEENPFDNSEDRAAALEADASMREAFEAGRQAMAAEDYEEAIRQFGVAAEGNTTQHILYGNLGQAYERAGQYAEAAEQYEQAQAIADAQQVPPETANYYTNLTLVYAMTGDVDRAIEKADLAAAINPEVAGMSFYNIGAVLTNVGQTEAAIAAFQRAVEVDPGMADAHFQLGLSYFGADSVAEAVPALERYLELAPDGADAETARGLLEFAEQQ